MNETPAPQPSSIQRMIGWLRFWLNVRANVSVVLHNQAQVATANQNLAAHVRRLNARLDYYEHTVPMLGKAGAQFRANERKEFERAAAQQNYAEREARRATQAEPAKPQLEVVSR